MEAKKYELSHGLVLANDITNGSQHFWKIIFTQDYIFFRKILYF
jgi:hypothetical protein